MIEKLTKKYGEDKLVIGFILLCFIASRLTMLAIWRIYSGGWGIRGAIDWFNTWDSAWYKDIAEGMFSQPMSLPFHDSNGQAGYAFFPLYPFLCGLVRKALPFLTTYQIGSGLSSVFFMIGEYAAYKYIRLTRDNRMLPYLYILIMSMGPYSFYFSVTYTEALFLMLLVLCFYFMAKEQYVRMGLCGMLLSATRNVGVFFCFCLLVYWTVKCYREHEGKHVIREITKKTFRTPYLILGAALVPLGLFAYMFFLKQYTGDLFAFVNVQRAWGKEQVGFFHVLWQEIGGTFPPTFWGVNMVISMVLIGWLAVKKRYDEALYPAMVLVIAGMSAAASIPRYMVGSFGVMLALSEYISGRSKGYRRTAVLLLAGYEILLINAWVNHSSSLI